MANDEDSTRSGMIGDWSESGNFFGAILAGIVLGFGADRLFGTEPLLLVLGAVAGFGVGFWRMYQIAKHVEVEELRKRADRPHP